MLRVSPGNPGGLPSCSPAAGGEQEGNSAVGSWMDGWAGDGVVPFGSAFVEVAFMVELMLRSVVALAKAAQMVINIQSTKHP